MVQEGLAGKMTDAAYYVKFTVTILKYIRWGFETENKQNRSSYFGSNQLAFVRLGEKKENSIKASFMLSSTQR